MDWSEGERRAAQRPEDQPESVGSRRGKRVQSERDNGEALSRREQAKRDNGEA